MLLCEYVNWNTATGCCDIHTASQHNELIDTWCWLVSITDSAFSLAHMILYNRLRLCMRKSSEKASSRVILFILINLLNVEIF